MTTAYDKAKIILQNTLAHVEFTGNLRTSVHVYNIAVALDNTNPKNKIEQALEVLFDIVDGKKNQNKKVAIQYLKTLKTI